MARRDGGGHRIRIDDARRATLVRALQAHFADAFDEPLSAFRAEGLVDLFLRELGPAVYNQGVRDACAHLQERLLDLEAELHEADGG
jgi:uncharacterized protein (DUF2164 family)